MPKMKTKRAAAKRFKLTGSGKLMDNEEDHALSVMRKSSKTDTERIEYSYHTGNRKPYGSGFRWLRIQNKKKRTIICALHIMEDR